MKVLTHLGRALFSIAFIGFGINHFRKPDKIVEFVPDFLPAELLWVYLVGILFIILGLMMLVNFKTKVAAFALAALIAVLTAFVYLPDIWHNKMAIAVYTAFVGAAIFIASKSD